MAEEVEVVFEIEQAVYDGVQKICKENGTTIEEITRDFLYFCADPKNTPFCVSPLGIIKKSINLMGTPASGERLEVS